MSLRDFLNSPVRPGEEYIRGILKEQLDGEDQELRYAEFLESMSPEERKVWEAQSGPDEDKEESEDDAEDEPEDERETGEIEEPETPEPPAVPPEPPKPPEPEPSESYRQIYKKSYGDGHMS